MSFGIIFRKGNYMSGLHERIKKDIYIGKRRRETSISAFGFPCFVYITILFPPAIHNCNKVVMTVKGQTSFFFIFGCFFSSHKLKGSFLYIDIDEKSVGKYVEAIHQKYSTVYFGYWVKVFHSFFLNFRFDITPKHVSTSYEQSD